MAQRCLLAPLPGPLRLGLRLAQLCRRKRRAEPPRRGSGPGPSPRPSLASAPPAQGAPEELTAKLAIQAHARVAAGSGLPALRRGPALAADTQAPPLDGGGGRGACWEVRSARPRRRRSSSVGGAGAETRRQLGPRTRGVIFPDAGVGPRVEPSALPGECLMGTPFLLAGGGYTGGRDRSAPWVGFSELQPACRPRLSRWTSCAAAPVPPEIHTQPAHTRNCEKRT